MFQEKSMNHPLTEQMFFKMKKVLVFIFCFTYFGNIFSQDFVYRPKNPAFGGETFNYNWMLSSAQTQDNFEDPKRTTSSRKSSLEDFQESLNRQILSQISRQLVSSQFGEGSLKEGSYSVGTFDINVSNGLEGVIININDTSNGEQTQVIIPFP
jgi:curli production assembly/transport component CsgF